MDCQERLPPYLWNIIPESGSALGSLLTLPMSDTTPLVPMTVNLLAGNCTGVTPKVFAK